MIVHDTTITIHYHGNIIEAATLTCDCGNLTPVTIARAPGCDPLERTEHLEAEHKSGRM